MEQEQYPGKLPTFEEFIDWHDRIQYVENPRKLANYNCCAAIIKTMAQEYEEIKFGSHSIEGGVEFTLHLNTVSYLPDFNVLLGELISRCQMFSPVTISWTGDCCWTFDRQLLGLGAGDFYAHCDWEEDETNLGLVIFYAPLRY